MFSIVVSMAMAAATQGQAYPAPMTVYFAYDQAALTEFAKIKLSHAADTHKKVGGAIWVIGHTDQHGDGEVNDELSQKRAQSAREFLISKGVPSDQVFAEGFGERRPIGEVADGTREPEFNRVEVTFGPEDAW